MEIPMEKTELLQEADTDDEEEAYSSAKITLKEGLLKPEADFTRTGSSEANFWLYLATSMAAVGGITFGYDMGIVSGALLQLRPEMNLSCHQREVIVSAMLAGAVVGSLTGGFLLDWFGRRTTLLCNALVLLIGSVILSVAPSYHILVIGRLIVGYGIAVSSTGECVYVSEISPAAKRGKFVLLNETGICFGILLAYLVNFCLIRTEGGWRYMFLFSAVPTLGQAVGMYILPESPRYLLMNDKDTASYVTLQKLRCTADVLEEWTDLKEGIKEEQAQNHSLWDLCGSHMNMKGRMLIGIGLVFFEGICGQTAVLYYAPTIFQVLGFSSNSSATLATVGLGFTKLMSSIIALFSVDVIGRRKLLLIGGCMMAVVVTLLGVVVQILPSPTSHSLCDTRDEGIQPTLAPVMIQDEPNDHRMIRKNIDSSPVPTGEKYLSIKNIISKLEISENNNSLNKMTNKNLFDDSKLQKDSKVYAHHVGKGESRERALSHTESSNVLSNRITKSSNQFKQTTSIWPKLVAVFSLMGYVFGFSLGYGPVVWLLLSEIFPAEFRGRASSIANSVKVINIVISLTFLDILNAIGASSTFYVFGAICFTSVIFIFLYVPETNGKSLEDISVELSKRKCCRCLEHNQFNRMRDVCYSNDYHIA